LRRNKADASAVILTVIILIFAAGVVFTVYTLRFDPIDDAVTADRVVNVLFVFEHQEKPLSSFVLMCYPATGKAAIFDIPGDIGLIIRHLNRVDRIDTAYDPRNAASFRTEIEGLLGVEINYSFVINTESLGRAVDLIEGVELLIPSPVEIYSPDLILFPSGKVRLDGDKARMYMTYEIPEEDREMAVFRRQRFFLGFLRRLGEMNETLKNPEAARLFRSCFNSPVTQRTKTRLFDEFAAIDADRTNIQAVSGNFRTVSGQTLLLPHYNGSLIKEIVRQSLGTLTRRTEAYASERVFTVEVLNGTSINGQAGRTAELLRGFGYDVISIGNAGRNDYAQTQIIDRSGLEDMARGFGEIIRCTSIRFESPVSDIPEPGSPEADLPIQNFEYLPDFTLIIGRDFDGRYVSDR
jgi:anionic cell wall polymer biosynthesis LytR-Cps2A-Psr (LCP) family protein